MAQPIAGAAIFLHDKVEMYENEHTQARELRISWIMPL